MSIDKKDLIAIRDRSANDLNFILASFLRGLRFGNDWFELIDSGIYYNNYDKFIKNLLNKPSVTVKISCLKEDPEVILGYAIYEDNKLHFTFVKKSWRGIGIAKSMIPSNITVFTHLTTIGRAIMQKHNNVIFNPFFN